MWVLLGFRVSLTKSVSYRNKLKPSHHVFLFNFQIQLEKIRDSDTQVRWQHEEDVDECPTCRSAFTVKKKKEHCRHCGTIFCTSCLSHVVRSGPNMRPSKVCDVCHTLLVKSSAPYFSEAPPQNN